MLGVLLKRPNTDQAYNLWALGVSFALAFVFFAPYLVPSLLGKEYVFFISDQLVLSLPHFIYGAQLFRDGIFSGLDMLTFNGGSEFFLRPNVAGRYPVYDLFYLFGAIVGGLNWPAVKIVILALQCGLSVFFVLKLGRKFFALSRLASVFWAILATFAAFRFPYTPYIIIYTLGPWVLYTALKSFHKPTLNQLILYSFPYTLMALGGYLPMALACMFLMLLSAVVYQYYADGKTFRNVRAYMDLLIPPTIAGFVVFPLYLAILIYHSENYGGLGTTSLYYAAHDIAHLPSDILGFLSYSFNIPRAEGGHVILGLLPVVIAGLFLKTRVSGDENRLNLKPFMVYGTIVFALLLLNSMGRFTGLSDIFHYLVPVFGGMHIYARYLLISFVIFTFVFAFYADRLDSVRDHKGTYYVLWGSAVLVIFLGVGSSSGLIKIPNWDVEKLIVELSLVAFFLVLLIKSGKKAALSFACAAVFILAAGKLYSYTNWAQRVDQTHKGTQLYYQDDLKEKFHKYLKANSNKDKLIKYVDFSSSIHSDNVILRNYPWMVRDQIKLSNYLGYEIHLARYKGLIPLFPWYGEIDLDYVYNTGADFGIFDIPALDKYKPQINDLIDLTAPRMELKGNKIVVKLSKRNSLYMPGEYLVRFKAWSEPKVNNVKVKIADDTFSLDLTEQPQMFSFRVNTSLQNEVFAIDFSKKLRETPVFVSNVLIGKGNTPETANWLPIRSILPYGETDPLTWDGPDWWAKIVGENGGLFVAKKLEKIDLHNIPAFDNGIMSVWFNGAENAEITDFETNYANKISYISKSPLVSQHRLNLYNSPQYTLYIDGKEVAISQDALNMNFKVPQGEHLIEIKYRNTIHTVFLYFYTIYLLIVVSSLLKHIAHSVMKTRWRDA